MWWCRLASLLTVYLKSSTASAIHAHVFAHNYIHVLFIIILFIRTVAVVYYVTVFQLVIARQVAVMYAACLRCFSVFTIQD
jgi:hypothetical protein